MKNFNNSYDSLADEAKKILEGNTLENSESEELDESRRTIPPLLLSILKTAAIAGGKALLKALLDKAEKQKISPREYEKASSNFDKNGTLDKLKSADPRYRAAERGGRNPFPRGTLAYELFNDLEEQTAKASGESISESKLVDMIKYSGAVGLFSKKVAKVITDEDEAALFPTGMITRDGVAMQEILLNYIANKMGTDPKEKFGPYFDRVDLVGPGRSGKTALRGALDPRKKHKIKDLIKALKTFKEETEA